MLMRGFEFVLHPRVPRRGQELEGGRRVPAHVPPLPSSCVQVTVTGTAPDWSEKKITPDEPALKSP